MQTFLPFSDFEATARALDTKRLGKQRVEVIQIVRALTWPGYGWASHPAVLMWKGYEEALGRYGLVMCDVWQERGFGDTCASTIATDLRAAGVTSIRSYGELEAAAALPPWLFDPALTRSHQSALVRKDPGRYRQLFPDVPDDLPYWWPVRSPAVVERERRRKENAARRQQRVLEKVAADVERRRRRRV
ncbi:MSMEG_6728 family protein [Georgenia sp. AZ-5]|uniref:MSMEG_6728 family protein n=1 Tax=Georgenia sp. AZ-5 TaxID=3367526 RepID=UPI0037541CAF